MDLPRMGKDWARGLSAATDARVARAAAGHRGLKYASRTPRDPFGRVGNWRSRWARIRLPGIDAEWTPEFAYAIGLLATDGCLGGRKAVILTSKDRDLLETFKRCIAAEAPIGRNRHAYRVQVMDVRFYRWLEWIGVTPRKSLTLGALSVPDAFVLHTVRGLLDGDGSIYTGLTIPNRKRYPHHSYQRLWVRFHSASLAHIEWLRALLERSLGIRGFVTFKRPRTERHAIVWILRYAKHESMRLLDALYADPAAPCLERKWKSWVDFRDHGKPTRTWTRRSSVGPRPPCDNRHTPE